MNSSHNNGESNGTLHDDLEQISRDYKSMEEQEPPELLDQAILSAAHRAVERKPGWMQFGWLHGLTTTAVIVLAISLVWQQKNTSPAFKDAIGPNTPTPLQSQKTANPSAPRATAKSTGPEIKMDENSLSRQKMSISESPSILQNEAEPVETVQSRESGDVQVVTGTRLVDEEVAEYRIDADKKETPVRRAFSDEIDSVAEVMEEEVSHQTTGVSVQEDQQQTELTVEEHLAMIIRLKNAGDESWHTKLLEFKKRFPDYPVPEELER